MATAATLSVPTRHPLNRDFVWRDAAANPRYLAQAQVDQFNELGFCIVRGAFTRAELAEVEAAIDPIEAQYEAFVAAQAGGRHVLSTANTITFAAHLVAMSETLARFAAHPVFKGLCRDLIGPEVRLYWDQAVYKKTGKPQEFPWHQDNGYTFVEPQQYLTCWTPLVDVDEANGCPWIAPKLHKLGTLAHWKVDEGQRCLDEASGAVAAPAKAGDVIVFSSLAPHRTGPNLVPDSVRKAYILQYAPDGAVAVKPDGERIPQNDPKRQFPILVGGR